MKRTAYGTPLLINRDNSVTPIEKVQEFDEVTIQKIIFDHPACLPISDIDEAYNPVVPVCMEMNTTVGPLDIFMVSPNGELTIIETKLWRNPEARRKVVAQILDYAKELASWTYDDLQREVNRSLDRKGNTLYEIAKEADPDTVLDEADFVDSVSRNLSRGNFLLLIVGDGIREGARGIGEFLSNAGHLNFTFAMVELSLYKTRELEMLVIPKTIVKTVELGRINIDLPQGMIISQDEKNKKGESIKDEDNFYRNFWEELIDELDFDDPGQPLPKPGNAQNLYVYPGKTKKAWISAHFHGSQNQVGVYFRSASDQEGLEIIQGLELEKDNILKELGDEIEGNWNELGNIAVRMPCNNPQDPKYRQEIKEFFKHWLNEFVNALRPRLKQHK